ncbi:HpcH/HpaI aldolase/citrate lyase family protein [Sphingobium herbicidovorans]|uniref:HpcH/HpaI aldolase/citrate lyase family protein n=1 Tax=Sphingobium herbicidovorans TaxID=76947 RepID=UPI000A63247E|nr:aldolase/citrate lyase family protein [Sphingobium herbicidovorans]
MGYGPEGLILDLEDAVPPAEKVGARAITRDGIAFLKTTGVGAFVRINPLDEGGVEDVLSVTTAGLTCILLPKLRDADQVRELADLLSYAEGKAGMERGEVSIMAIPETAEGLCDVRQLASASPRVKSVLTAIIDRVSDDVVFTGDTVLAAGFIPTREGFEQIYLTSKLCVESRAGGAAYPMASLIGTDLQDREAAVRIAKRMKATGFTGCVAIHPNHVAVANEIFRPTPSELKFQVGALKAMREAEAAGLYAVRYRGMMIDRANVALAEKVIADARRCGMEIPAEEDL